MATRRRTRKAVRDDSKEQEWIIGQQVRARWQDCKTYRAVVMGEISHDKVQIQFEDGIVYTTLKSLLTTDTEEAVACEIESHDDRDNGDPLDFPESVDDSKDKPSPMSEIESHEDGDDGDPLDFPESVDDSKDKPSPMSGVDNIESLDDGDDGNPVDDSKAKPSPMSDIESLDDGDDGNPLDFPESVDDSKDKPSPMSGVDNRFPEFDDSSGSEFIPDSSAESVTSEVIPVPKHLTRKRKDKQKGESCTNVSKEDCDNIVPSTQAASHGDSTKQNAYVVQTES